MADIVVEEGNRRLELTEKNRKEKRVIQADGYINGEKILTIEYQYSKGNSMLFIISNLEWRIFMEHNNITVDMFQRSILKELPYNVGKASKVSVWEKGKKKPISFRPYKNHSWDIYIDQVCLKLKKPYLHMEILDIVNAGLFNTLFKKYPTRSASLWEWGEWELLYKQKKICDTFPTIGGINYQLINPQCLQNICTSTFLDGLQNRENFFDMTKAQDALVAKIAMLHPKNGIINVKTVNPDGTVEFL